jgi:alkylhydroperoxidase family enzyme
LPYARDRRTVVAAMPTLDPVPLEEMDQELRELLAPRVERLGYLGAFFQFTAHQPDALGHFMRFTEALKDALDWRYVEIIALTISTESRNAYERVQHERLALRLGMSAEEVRTLVAGQATEELFSRAEVAAADLARCIVCADGRHCHRRFQRLLAETDPATAVAALLSAARYLAHSAISTTLMLEPPVPSPFEEAGPDA